MSRYFVSPMGDPTFSNAAASLAQALFPDPRREASARIAGAQYQGQLANNEQTRLENVGLADTNAAWDGGPAATGLTPEVFARLRLARGSNAAQLASAIGAFQEQGFRQGAADAALSGNLADANANLFGVARGPVTVNAVQGGYQLNPVAPGGAISATGETMADIALKNARAEQAGASTALIEDRRANPERYRAPPRGGTAGSPKPLSASEALSLDKLIGMFSPEAVPDGFGDTVAGEFPADLRNAVLVRAGQLRAEGVDALAATQRAIEELTMLEPGKPGEDGWIFNTPAVPARRVPRAAAPAAPAVPAAAPAQAPYPDGTRLTGPDGKLYVVRGGVPVLEQ